MTSSKSEVIVIDEALINKAIEAIKSTEPSPKDREDMLLAQLIPAIAQALRRGDSKAKVCGAAEAASAESSVFT